MIEQKKKEKTQKEVNQGEDDYKIKQEKNEFNQETNKNVTNNMKS